ncbi:Na+/H+ antiporter NhaC family protein [Cytobacillus depressus]|uniref:Na+/H+ antiporter NhaC family protein n=1 Tax=Cytobacillus depressus TaxID=1602942 RepID=UPI0031B5DCC1
MIFWTGYAVTEGEASIFKIFENADVSKSPILGGVFGLAVTLDLFFRQAFVLKGVSCSVFAKGLLSGIKSILAAVYILIFAWAISDLIGRLETGKYMANLVQQSSINI